MSRRKSRGSRPIDDELPRPGREEGRRQRHEAGARSAAAAHGLMELPEAAFKRLELEAELREEAAHSRTITSNVARRREERRLAGILRGRELEQVESELSKVEGQGRADALQFKRAEDWRERLLDAEANSVEDAVAVFLSEVGGVDADALRRQVQDARRQVFSGRRGAAKELFRQVVAALRAKNEGQPRQPPRPSRRSSSGATPVSSRTRRHLGPATRNRW